MGEIAKPLAAGLLAPVTGGASLLLLAGTPKVKTPTPPEAPPTPTTDAAPVQEASAQAAARRSRSAGFRSTIISKQNSLLSQIGQPALKDTIGS